MALMGRLVFPLLHLLGGDVATFLHLLGLGVAVATMLPHRRQTRVIYCAPQAREKNEVWMSKTKSFPPTSL